MRRIELPEIHDHPRFPGFLRDLVTDALQALWQFGNSYRPILPVLAAGLAASSQRAGVANEYRDCVEILDLCSGGSGPWLRLVPQLERDYQTRVHVCLTDKYPNHSAFARASTEAKGAAQTIRSVADSVDATCVPRHLSGFRTIFSSFHHFGPTVASAVLRDAVEDHRGIGIFEVARRGPKTMLTLCFTPWLLLLLTPSIHPFRWSRLLWTYLIPVVPFVIWYDGIVSCLRAYSLRELSQMMQEAAVEAGPEYTWQLGEAQTGLLPVTYLVGYPAVRSEASGMSDAERDGVPQEALS